MAAFSIGITDIGNKDEAPGMGYMFPGLLAQNRELFLGFVRQCKNTKPPAMRQNKLRIIQKNKSKYFGD